MHENLRSSAAIRSFEVDEHIETPIPDIYREAFSFRAKLRRPFIRLFENLADKAIGCYSHFARDIWHKHS